VKKGIAKATRFPSGFKNICNHKLSDFANDKQEKNIEQTLSTKIFKPSIKMNAKSSDSDEK
jgi:hypothetical protein